MILKPSLLTPGRASQASGCPRVSDFPARGSPSVLLLLSAFPAVILQLLHLEIAPTPLPINSSRLPPSSIVGVNRKLLFLMENAAALGGKGHTEVTEVAEPMVGASAVPKAWYLPARPPRQLSGFCSQSPTRASGPQHQFPLAHSLLKHIAPNALFLASCEIPENESPQPTDF